MKRINLTIIVLLIFLGYSDLFSQFQLDLETGLVISGYNDVRIPGTSGTPISLSEELKTDPAFFFRVRLNHSISDRHTVSMLVAPLRLQADGKVNRPVRFETEDFPANTPLKAKYRFDSYRLTYRYDFYRGDKFQTGLGLTAKIRDASISLEGDSKKSEKKNTGFVPLINFRVQWMFAKAFDLVLDGDALVGPQGRAEDVLFALQYKLGEKLGLKLGYRILEGGADVDEVYNFTLLNYIVLGAVVTIRG